jgi:hypothetical protein
MKKTLLAVIAILSALPFISKAQTWSGSTPGNIYYNSGNVGLGTTTPISGGSAASWLTVNGSSSYSGGVAYAIGGDVKGFSYIAPDGLLTQQSLYTGQKFVVNTSTTAMTILTDGNVGIGTTSPSAKLDIDGNQRLNGDLLFAGDQTAYFIKGPGNGGAIRIRSNIGAAVDRNIQFGNVDNNGSWHSYMIVDQSGNVGIGTTNPDQLLSVKGVVHSQVVKVDMTGWSDFVFKPEYKLPTLASVKAYIDKNQHLPEIPSEQEITKNGLDLGEMNKLLLKKVEELTLYLIEKDKQVNEQKIAIDELILRVKNLENK